MTSNKKIFLVAGPSAVGKNTIVEELLKIDLPLGRMITTTSRPRRTGDKLHEYHFVSQKAFELLVANKEMLEWVEFNNNLYGTRRRDLEDVLAKDKFPILIIDVQGVEFFKKNFKNAVSIFILPSSLTILRRRLEKRKMTEANIRSRLKIAQEEIKQAPEFDYRVINYDGKLANVVKEVAEIIRREIS